MRISSILAAAASLFLAAAPAMAASANPAASLALPPTRTGSSTAHDSKLAGGGIIYAFIILAGIAAISIVGATNNDNPRSS